MIKNSKVYHFTDSILKPRKELALIEQYKAMVEKSLTLSEFKRNFGLLGSARDCDITFYGYVLKVISCKSPLSGE